MKDVNESISEYIVQKHKEMREKKDAEDKLAQVADESSPQQPVNSAASKADDKEQKSDVKDDEAKKADDAKKEDEEAEKKKEEDKLSEQQKELELLEAKRKEEDLEMIRQISLTDEQKKALREIYDQMIYVKFRWGGFGHMKVRLSS